MRVAPRSLPWITRLIAHDATSRNSNLMLIEDVRGHVDALGLPTRLTFNHTRSKANLFTTIPDADGNLSVSAHKGVRQHRCRVHGRSAHSSRTTDGVNAIEYAARIIAFYRSEMEDKRLDPHRDTEFDIPFTTGSVGSVQGGTAINIVAQDCEFLFDCRPMPGYDVEALERRLESYIANEIVPAMQAEHADTNVSLERLVTVPSLTAGDESPLLALAKALTRIDRPAKVAYSTEAGQFAGADIDTIVCGPGDIALAHRPNEDIELKQIAACERFLLGVAESLAA